MASFVYSSNNDEEEDGVKYCSCCRFTNGIDLPSPGKLTGKEVLAEAPRYAGRILKNWILLKACLNRFEPIIRKRWAKKTDKQRREILLTAWPEIPKHHRPDFMGCRTRKKPTAIPRTVTTTRQNHAFLYPYINLQDLQQGHLIPMFLHSRGRALPEAFVNADLGNAHRGHGWPGQPEDGQLAMAFAGGRTPRKYGRMFLNKATTTQRIVRPTYAPIVGLFILEVQDGIYDFLLSCCRTILHDVDACEWRLAPSLPALGAPEPDERRGEWTSLPRLALEAPYCAPCQLDIDRLQLLISVKRLAAEDHIWLLREDPGYFLDALKDCYEHGRESSYMRERPESAWQHVAGQLMAEAFCSFYCWTELDNKLAMMIAIEDQISRANAKKGRLAPYDEATWAYLDHIIDQLIWIPLSALTRGVPEAPRIRAMSYTTDPSDLEKDSWEIKHGRSDSEHRIYTLFSSLFSERQREMHGLNKLIQEIQHTMETDPDAYDLLDSWIIERFSDIALLTEVQRSISSFQPWATGWRLHKVAGKGVVNHLVENAIDRDQAHFSVLTEAPCAGKIHSLGIPTDGRFYYPIDKKRTKETIDEIRAAEKNLAAYWLDVAKFFRTRTGRGLFDNFHLYSGRTRGVQRTPAWVEPKAVKSPPVPITPSRPLPLREVDANAWHCKEVDNKKREIIDSAKAKIKTRGKAVLTRSPSPAPRAINDNAVDDEAPADAMRPKYKLPKRAYRVFSALLPSGSSLAHVGKEVAWDELLHAMNAVGLQPQKLYGSVWVFRPLPKERCLVRAERSIQFHEPKEVRRGSKIPPYMVRTLGRRLKHAYGWEGADFECA